MKTLFFNENESGQRWIDVEKNSENEFDVVLKTQGFTPDGGLYSDISRDVLGYGFESEDSAISCVEMMAKELGFSIP
ncbi:MAG: hypothetical protein SOV98_05880 [Limosilactobacillus sp.]|uniref:hypothetical protein n=1 Tax=Limosilactobacillus sp. TaxID=2773925 RepID=UPI002A75B62C|nr:hypothetical protein [Limosilactobacillus sp.]MDY2803458.1 hypothetical protein [Limosilactobacillus sp.]